MCTAGGTARSGAERRDPKRFSLASPPRLPGAPRYRARRGWGLPSCLTREIPHRHHADHLAALDDRQVAEIVVEHRVQRVIGVHVRLDRLRVLRLPGLNFMTRSVMI